jgi:hypothetical protein
MVSPGGEDLIGWHVNRGWEQEADFFPASQFRAQYNRPDIVRLVLQTKDEAEAVRRANAASDRKATANSVAAALPPRLMRPPKVRISRAIRSKSPIRCVHHLACPSTGLTYWLIPSQSQRPVLKRRTLQTLKATSWPCCRAKTPLYRLSRIPAISRARLSA